MRSIAERIGDEYLELLRATPIRLEIVSRFVSHVRAILQNQGADLSGLRSNVDISDMKSSASFSHVDIDRQFIRQLR